MKGGGGSGDSPPSEAVAHSLELCRISAGSVPPGKLPQTSQNCPRPLTDTYKQSITRTPLVIGWVAKTLANGGG